jgi:uncharacterized protein YxeA
MKNKNGEVTLTVIAVIAVIGLAVMWFKPSVAATNAKKVDEVTQKIEDSNQKVGQKVSASLNQIGVANSMAPESPSKNFISKEVALTTPLLPSPSMEELLQAEKRRVAVMEGHIEEANKLYFVSQKENAELIAENAKAKKDLTELKNDLYEQAGVAEFLKKVSIILGVTVTLLGAGFIWFKLHTGRITSGLREFISYTKDDKVLGELREALDSDIKKKLGL